MWIWRRNLLLKIFLKWIDKLSLTMRIPKLKRNNKNLRNLNKNKTMKNRSIKKCKLKIKAKTDKRRNRVKTNKKPRKKSKAQDMRPSQILAKNNLISWKSSSVFLTIWEIYFMSEKPLEHKEKLFLFLKVYENSLRLTNLTK